MAGWNSNVFDSTGLLKDSRVSQGSSPVTWEWDVPTLADETAFYTNVLGLTIPADAANFTSPGQGGYTWIAPSSYSFGDLHNLTEGDNLWAWDQQYKRYGATEVVSGANTTSDWRSTLLTYYKNNLLSSLDADDNGSNAAYGFDHMYGQGLCVIYNDTSDSSIITVLDGLRTRITGTAEYQTLDGGGTMNVATYEGRCVGRWTIVATYAYQATGSAAWQAVRDNLLDAFETSPDWQDGGVIRNAGGAYFASRDQMGFAVSDSTWLATTGYANGGAAYDAGYRMHSSFELAILVEAMWRLYVQTGSEIIRHRLIKIARYVQYYAHDYTWVGPNVGSRFGFGPNGERWHNNGGDSGAVIDAATDCSYDMSLVNTLVIGYKLTGDRTLLDRAHIHFQRGNRWDPGVPTTDWISGNINEIDKYLDTKQSSSTSGEFQFNKGALQYCYQVIENSGAPSPVTANPTWYTPLAQYEANVFASSDHQNNLGQYAGTSGNETGDTTLYSYSGGILNTEGIYTENGTTFQRGKWLCLFGGGHAAYNGNEIAAFGPLDSDSPSWVWAVKADPTTANTNVGASGQPNSQHTYAMNDYIESKNWLFNPFVNNRYSDAGSGFVTSAFDFSVANPNANYSTAWISTLSDTASEFGQYGGSFGAYDRFMDKFWLLEGRGQTVLYEYDVQSDTWTRHPGSGAYATLSYSDRQCCAIDPVTQVMMIVTADEPPNDNSLRCIDLRNPGNGIYKPGGTNHPVGAGGLLFDPVNRQWVYYEGGATMWVCPVPSNPYSGGDNFNFTSQTVSGDSIPAYQTKTGYGGGVWNRFRWCPQPQGYVFSGGWGQNIGFIRA